jgi:hypothetical protein
VDDASTRWEVPPVSIVELYCDRCAAVAGFQQPPCRDGHGTDCDEWACVACGAALLIASFTVRPERRRAAGGRRAA